MFNQLKQQVTQRINYLSEIIEKTYDTPVPVPRIRYVSRGTNAGMANFLSWTLTFNKVILIENAQHFIENTVAHEFAHLITDMRSGIQQFPHGLEWRKIMKLFNVVPTVTHQYDVTKLLNQKRIWLCGCQSHYVTMHVANQLHQGKKYVCDLCGVPVHQ